DVLEERELEIPKTLRIVLRGFEIDGADDTDYPVYSLTDHFFAMNDGTDGEVSMFDGFYTASIDDGTFESVYTRIESVPEQEEGTRDRAASASNRAADNVPDRDSGGFPDRHSDGIPTDGSDGAKKDGLDGDLNVTIRKDQPIWPEWTSEETSSDIGGGEYVLVDGEWLPYAPASKLTEIT
ncbi:MAG: hypothetical protein IJW67_11125, partial [Blautia sp.]|nr:hypothetical protein [Blautia sp.]